MKKVAIIGTAGVPSKYGGFETLAHQLVHYLGGKFSLFVYCSTKYYPKKDRKKYYEKPVFFMFRSMLYKAFSMTLYL